MHSNGENINEKKKTKRKKKKKKNRCAGDKHSRILSFRYFCLFVCLNHMGLEKILQEVGLQGDGEGGW